MRKTALFFICMALIAFLCACMGEGDNTMSETTPAATTPTETTPTETTPAETTPAETTPAVTEKVYVAPDAPVATGVHANQVGYYTNGIKRAIVVGGGSEFWLVDSTTGQVVYIGKVEKGSEGVDATSGEIVCYADFSDFTTAGNYFLALEGGAVLSYPFDIKDGVYADTMNTVLHSYYHLRCGTEQPEQYAGSHAHAACHTYDSQIWNGWDSSATPVYKNVSGGWHDAGDYSKSPYSGSIGISKMFCAYILNPEIFGDDTNIPERGNGIPDILDEARYEIEFMLKMQYEDGGVPHTVFPHKHAAHNTFEDEDKQMYYIYPAGYEATGAFASVCAWAYRLYKEYDSEFASTCLEAAKRAYEYLDEHPEDKLYQEFGYTNGYGSLMGGTANTTKDERYAAAIQLYLSCGEKRYLQSAKMICSSFTRVSEYFNNDFASFAYVAYKFDTSSAYERDKWATEVIEETLLEGAKTLSEEAKKNPYGLAYNLFWRSMNTIMIRNAVLMQVAMLIDPSLDYSTEIQSNINYILGTNPQNMSWVTGVGEYAVTNLHYRRGPYSGRIALPPAGFVPFGAGAYEYAKEAYAKLSDYFSPDIAPMKCYIMENCDNHTMSEFHEGTQGTPIMMFALAELMSK